MRIDIAGIGDIKDVVHALDERALAFACAANHLCDRAGLARSIRHSPGTLYAVFDRYDVAVALALLVKISPTTAELSFTAAPAWRRVAVRSLRWWLRHRRSFLAQHGIRRIETRIDLGHVDAIRLLIRLGFVLETLLPLFGRDGTTQVLLAWRDAPAATIDADVRRLTSILAIPDKATACRRAS